MVKTLKSISDFAKSFEDQTNLYPHVKKDIKDITSISVPSFPDSFPKIGRNDIALGAAFSGNLSWNLSRDNGGRRWIYNGSDYGLYA